MVGGCPGWGLRCRQWDLAQDPLDHRSEDTQFEGRLQAEAGSPGLGGTGPGAASETQLRILAHPGVTEGGRAWGWTRGLTSVPAGDPGPASGLPGAQAMRRPVPAGPCEPMCQRACTQQCRAPPCSLHGLSVPQVVVVLARAGWMHKDCRRAALGFHSPGRLESDSRPAHLARGASCSQHVPLTCRSHAVCSPPPTVGRLGARTFIRGQQLLAFHEAGQGVPCGARGAGCGLPFSGAVLTGQHWVRCLCLWVGETTFPASEGPGGQASRKLSSFPPWPPRPITDSHPAGMSTGFTLIPVLKWWSDATESIPSLYR